MLRMHEIEIAALSARDVGRFGRRSGLRGWGIRSQ